MGRQVLRFLVRPNLLKPVGGIVLVLSLLGTIPYFAHTQEDRGEMARAQTGTQQTPMSGVTSSTMNPLQIAMLHWYDANRTTRFKVPTNPAGMAFDGTDIWIANEGAATITRMRISDGWEPLRS